MASTQQLSINLGLAALPETTDPILFSEAARIYNAIKILAGALDNYTGALPPDEELWPSLSPEDTIRVQSTSNLYVHFSEAVGIGELVTLWDDAGTLKAKKAGGNPWAGDTRGFTSANVAIDDFGEVVLFGLHPYVAGATLGALYYTSNITAGLLTAVKPVIHGNKLQPVAVALRANRLFFAPSILVPTVDTTSLAITVLTP